MYQGLLQVSLPYNKQRGEKVMKQYYKVARPDGFDFHTGRTINYHENIGKIVNVPKKTKLKTLCSSDVLHASELFFDALGYGELPCSIFVVEGEAVTKQSDKAGFKKLKIIREIDTKNWKSAYYKFMIWMLEDLKNNFDNEKEKQVTNTINQTIKVFSDALNTGKINESAAESAARSAELAACSAACSAAESAARSAARSAWSAWSAWSARLAESAWSAAWSAELAARSASWLAESAARSKKKKQLSDKFIELLEADK